MDPKDALVNSIKNRALIYLDIYQTLSEEYGREQAISLMKKAIYKRGQEKANQQKIEKNDFHALGKAFLKGGDSSLNVFGNEVAKVEEDGAVLRLNCCTLVDAWKEAGLSPEEVITMCDIAYQVDFGKFEGLGFTLKFGSRICEGHACCELNVTKGKN